MEDYGRKVLRRREGARSPASENVAAPRTHLSGSGYAGTCPNLLAGAVLSRNSSQALTPDSLFWGGKSDLAIGGGEMILYQITPDNTPEVRRRGYDPGEAVAPGETETLSFDATVTGRFGVEEGRAERVPEVLLLRVR